MKWGWQDIITQCDRLEPERPCKQIYGDFWILDASNGVVDHRLSVRSPRGTSPILQHADARVLDLFMTSSEFDQSLFVTLITTIGMDRMTALEVCLS